MFLKRDKWFASLNSLRLKISELEQFFKTSNRFQGRSEVHERPVRTRWNQSQSPSLLPYVQFSGSNIHTQNSPESISLSPELPHKCSLHSCPDPQACSVIMWVLKRTRTTPQATVRKLFYYAYLTKVHPRWKQIWGLGFLVNIESSQVVNCLKAEIMSHETLYLLQHLAKSFTDNLNLKIREWIN